MDGIKCDCVFLEYIPIKIVWDFQIKSYCLSITLQGSSMKLKWPNKTILPDYIVLSPITFLLHNKFWWLFWAVISCSIGRITHCLFLSQVEINWKVSGGRKKLINDINKQWPDTNRKYQTYLLACPSCCQWSCPRLFPQPSSDLWTNAWIWK